MAISTAGGGNAQILDYSDFIKMVVQGIDTAVKELNEESCSPGITYTRSRETRFAIPSVGGQFDSIVSFDISKSNWSRDDKQKAD